MLEVMRIGVLLALGGAAAAQEEAPDHVPSGAAGGAVTGYEAEQQVATGRFTTAVEVKPIMEATRANWIAVREYGGQDLVYVTQLWSWRCGMAGLHVGVNGAELEPWPLPDCHEDTNAPNAVLEGDGLPYRAFPPGSVEMVTVEIVYDDLSTDRATYNRQGAMIP